MLSRLNLLFVAVLMLPLASVPAAAQSDKIDFNRDVRPILSNTCFACHGPDEKQRKGGLRLDIREGAIKSAVVPGEPDTSELVKRVGSGDPDEMMPPRKSGKKLTAREIDILKRWVKQGAGYAAHWAYVKPVRPAVPDIKSAQFELRNPIDNFIAARLIQEGLSQSPPADKMTLIRRVSLDLIGLPPTIAEVDVFLNDESPDAYEKLVDRLLAKPAFGEHWARMWLDLARYADSAGYADDPHRTIWKYRDWVIDALNKDMPFDRFTIEQLAGDLLPNPTTDQLVATAFHRNTMTNNEGGTSDEEFRNVAVVDRVNTTLTVWMGTSIACCQCHNHKYDRLTQKEFFQLFAFFNNTADADRSDESPTLPFYTPQQRQKREQVSAEIDKLEAALKDMPKEEGMPERTQLAALKKQLAALKPETSVPIMKELNGSQRRKTRIQHRGNFLDVGDEVSEGVPAVFPPLPADAMRNRLILARWLVSPEHPLTGRVIANRFWEQFFGVGLVRTSEEFGTQGEPPSHPELLDWLACELMCPSVAKNPNSKWSVKAFLNLVVTSATYRQSAKVTTSIFEKDPENRLLGRGPRVRLTAEMVRDQALFAAGLLSSKINGPSVKPPQPTLGVNAAFGGAIDWKPSTGEDRYRRALYTEWRRSNPYPSMATFDAPNRDICIVRRARTNTPLQALVTMNDPVYVEAAQGLARRMFKEGGKTSADRIKFAFRTCFARPPHEDEIKRLIKLDDDAQKAFAKDAKKALQFATTPSGPLPEGFPAIDAAALTVVASVILNLDEMFMKR